MAAHISFSRCSPLFLILFAHIISTTFAEDLLKNLKEIQIIKYEYGKHYSLSINNSIEYIFEHLESDTVADSECPARVSVASIEANRTYPVFVIARQQKGILSWQLPMVIDEKELHGLSRTLCPNSNFFINGDSQGRSTHPSIHIYTSSLTNISVNLKVDLVNDFYLMPEETKSLTLTPSEPSVFYYSFDNDKAGGSISKNTESNTDQTDSDSNDMSKNVVVRIDSEDEHCMLVSIQNASCPVFDTENDIMFEGFYQTVSTRGGITVPKRRFPLGFYIVLVVKTSDVDCTGYSTNSTITQFSQFFDWSSQPYDHPDTALSPLGVQLVDERRKRVDFIITPSISYLEYWLATMTAVIVILLVYFIFLFGLYFFKSKPKTMDQVREIPVKVSREVWKAIIKDIPPYEAILQPHIWNNTISDHVAFMPDTNTIQLQPLPESTVENGNNCTNNMESVSPENVQIRNGNYSSLTFTTSGEIYLNQLCTKNTRDLKQQSALYLWHCIIAAVFYGLPVIQLVITYQRVLNQSGNQDLCYYNFLCAHPLGYLSDFNHVYSNLGYVLLGALFIFFVWRRHKQHQDEVFDQHFGIPQHHGLYYAMGVSLMMEGVLSGSYHVCPNHSNFQFDTSFMYIMAVLSMVKIYQTRHPDINAHAHSTFGVLAAAILICLFGVLYPNFYFWIFFTVLHIATCLILTFKIYYMGRGKFSFNCCIGQNFRDAWKPKYRSRCILVLIANLCNLGLAIYGLYTHSKDFASHLLYLFLMNLALHLTFYITMKITKGERPPIYAWVLLVVALITWGGALFFFFTPSTSWALTPAQSRSYNMSCKLLNFYDNHDIWHVLSAAAMFFSFMLLLTLDDDISHKPREKIPVF